MPFAAKQQEALSKMKGLMINRLKSLMSIAKGAPHPQLADFQALLKKLQSATINSTDPQERDVLINGLLSKTVTKYEILEEHFLDSIDDEDLADKETAESEKVNDELIDLADVIDKHNSVAETIGASVVGSASIAIAAIVTLDGGHVVESFQKKTASERLKARKWRLKYMRTAAGRAAMRRAKIKAKARLRMHKRPNAQRSRIAKMAHKAYHY